ncbi:MULTISPECIES: sigma-70 family RNA polymerase sigma factor [unclassified Dyella]|jgi:RNA polymerase sigma factor for flagellar operon FliA|uniref:sigma-70 family RNA polymerase sigma factor n=1 Tax=unclassified Dyella TaxID=2634549 RepID=UPI000CC89478|nr:MULTISPECIES: sigma-70 family RNA polymerase sigma factor [unclassified Dyella]MDR3443729.1 sigma-70 family RNA polymerase sigma factor [Dyella sp.]PMQ04564.1 RNA polymerase sigma factor FliA [Dyella sp. AD56]
MARSELVARHSDWARQIARSIYRRVYGLSGMWEDCAQNALVGLLESIDRFDPARGIDFELYARYRVRGCVFNGLRLLRQGPERIVGREARNEVVRERVESIQDDVPVDPLEAFVATAVGLGLGVLLEAQSLPLASLQPDAYAVTEERQRDALLADCVAALPERERLILVLHYYHHLPFIQLAERMEVTKGRVSQLHKQAIGRLRRMLQDHWTESV